MASLQEIFDKFINDNFRFERVVALIMRRKLKEQNIEISDEQLQKIEEQIIDSQDKSLSLEIDDGLIETKNIAIDLNDPEEFNRTIELINDAINDTAPSLIDKFTETSHEYMKAQIREMASESREMQESFNKNLYIKWGEAFDLLESFILLALDLGNEFSQEFRASEHSNPSFVFDALVRLHARGCQVASEVKTLITNGFADGAHARWRSLHEISIVALFIEEHGNEVAEKYLLHDNIESLKSAREFQQYYDALGEEPVPEHVLINLQVIHDNLIKRFGNDYGNDLGWAAKTLGKSRPRIKDIELSVGLEHLRPYYRLASHNIHANPKGLFFKLGLYKNQDLLLAGPSNIGLADPAQATAISLSQLTTSLMMVDPNIDRLVACSVLAKFSNEIADKFVLIQKNLEDESYKNNENGRYLAI